jgi:hypothetical protein
MKAKTLSDDCCSFVKQQARQPKDRQSAVPQDNPFPPSAID